MLLQYLGHQKDGLLQYEVSSFPAPWPADMVEFEMYLIESHRDEMPQFPIDFTEFDKGTYLNRNSWLTPSSPQTDTAIPQLFDALHATLARSSQPLVFSLWSNATR